MVKIKGIDTNHCEMVGDFEFSISTIIFDVGDLIPYQKISFPLNMECMEDMEAYGKSEGEAAEILAEKLKQDFKKALLASSFKKK